jgi:UNC-50 family
MWGGVHAVLQFFLSPLLLMRNFFSAVVASLLYVGAFSYYHYMNFLGYSALPFLEHTEVFLWPVPCFVLMLPFLILTGFNPTRFALGLFFPTKES